MDTSIRPEGTVSVTVTVVPSVGPVPFLLSTVTVYVAFSWPCVKLPVCVLVIASTGSIIVVMSLALAATEPPPETSTLFVCGVVAFAATLTVTVIGG